MSSETQSVDATPALTELLGDIPFTLAPHILAMQAGLPFVTDITLPHDINDKLANFRYDFSLENSVLCEPWLFAHQLLSLTRDEQRAFGFKDSP